MRVDWIITARFVEVHDGLATIVGGGIERYTVASFPAQFMLMMALRVVGRPDDNDHTLQMEILGSDMQTLAPPLSATFKMQQGAGAVEGWEVATIIPVGVALTVPEAGALTINATVDGESETHTVYVAGP